ncbi:MAG: response regulator, partial [Nitrospirota bacterium]|nr:response regulator [Nitrospirota bacterium]
VLADPIQISQILMNLCLNGAHSMSTIGGVLEISLLDVEMNSESMKDYPNLTPGPFVRLRVRDTGSGISPQVLKRIFDPFFTTKQAGEGTGMGLAVVQDIVNRHHGIMSVDSVLGQGTIFDIYLPRIPEVIETQEIVKVPVAKGNECILFVDNERSICELVRENLKHLGYTTVTETSSREALDMFVKTPDQFDLVITDLSMPQMNGERLAQELLSIRPDIPIILCTGLNQAFTDEHVKAIGVQGSLLKPFTESDVANTIRRVLDRAGEERSLRVIV